MATRKKWSIKVNSARDVAQALRKITNAVLNDELDTRKANSAGFLLNSALNAIKTCEYEKKLAELENSLAEMQEIIEKLQK